MTINFHVTSTLDSFHTMISQHDGQKKADSSIDVIKVCISRHTKQKSKSFLGNLLYKIGQIFLSIFGCSDWQKARKAINPMYVYLFKTPMDQEMNKMHFPNDKLHLKNKIKSIFENVINQTTKMFNKISDQTIEFLVRLNDLNLAEKDPKAPDVMTKLRNETGMEKSMDEIQINMQNLLSKAELQIEALSKEELPIKAMA